MKNDRLYIDNVLVDLGENVDITLIHNSNLFRDITKMTGNTTYTIRLPRTANNAAVFGMAGDLRADTTYPTQYHRADYIRGGVPIITNGCAVLLSVTDMYEISISWGAFSPLATIVNDGMTLNQLGGTDTILFEAFNKVTDYAQAMTDGYYYASYDPYINEVSNEWVSIDSAWFNQGSQSYTFTNGAVLTAAVGESMSFQPVSRTGSQYIVAPFKFGMVMFIDGVTGASDARAWCILDETNTVIQICDDLTLISGLSMRAPVQAAYIVINTTTGGTVSAGYYGSNKTNYANSFNTYKNMACRLPVVNVSWILNRIKLDTGVDFVFPYSVKAYLDTLAIPLVTANANALTLGGMVTMGFTNQYALGALGVLAAANTIFTEQSGTVFQLTATRYAKVTVDIQANYEWTFTGSTPQGHGSTTYDGVAVTSDNYSYASNYIEVKIVHDDPDAEDSIYIVGYYDSPSGQSVMSHNYESDNGTTFVRVLAGYGEIEILERDVITFTLKNKRGTLHDMFFWGGQMIINEAVDGEVPRGTQYPIVHNLPEIKITDFVQFLCAITACIPLNKQDGKVYFEEISKLFGSASMDWTTKIIPSNLDYEQTQELTYRINDYARKNWYKWKEDETVLGNYDGYMEINDDTLESEHVVMDFPFAASDGNRVPIFTRSGGGVFGGSGNDTPYEPSTLKGCEPRIMSVYQATNGTAALRFDIDMQDVIDTQMTGMAASLADVRVIKERIRMSDVELAAFDESMPVYLRQYGSFFAVLSLESNGDGTATATMLRLKKQASAPVPPPPPQPYDYEVDYLIGDGLAWINTGIRASNNVTIRAHLIDYFDESMKGKWAFGGRTAGGSKEFGMHIANDGKVWLDYGNNPVELSDLSAYHPRCHVEIGGGNYKIGATSGTYTEETFESNYQIYLFALNNAGGAVPSAVKIGAVQISDGVTTLDLIPVVKNGEGMMYDRNSGQLFPNDATGAFSWGMLPYDEEIDYLQSSGTQRIDTGIMYDSSVVVETKVYVLTSAKGSSVFGIYWDGGGGAQRWNFQATTSSPYGNAQMGTKEKLFALQKNTWVTLHADYRYITSNGTSYDSVASAFNPTDDVEISIFARHLVYSQNTHDSYINMRSESFKITKSGVLVRKYIPVKLNNIGYLYDIVSDTLFPNAGTGDFILGNTI